MTDEKETELKNLRNNIEAMGSHFSMMLKETLEKMKKKIEDANKKWEEENDGAMLKRFEEYANP